MRVLMTLVVLVAAEIAVLYLVGSAVGFLGLVAVLLGAALIGMWALRREGRRSMRALRDAARSGRPADAEVADGMLVGLAAALLILPGLVSDVLGLILLVPPVRRALARRVAASARRRAARSGPPRGVVVVDGTPVGSRYPDPRRPHAGLVIEGRSPGVS